MSGRTQKILLSPSAYYPSLGGVEEISRNLACCLSSKGYDVKVATNRHPLTLPEREELFGVDVHRFDFYYPGRSVGQMSQSWRALRGFLNFQHLIRSWKPDIVHVVCPSTNSLYCWAARNVLQFRLLVTLQGELFMDAYQIYERSQLARLGLARLLSVADGVTACSQYVLDDACGRYSINHSVQEVVFNGVDLSEGRTQTKIDTNARPYILGVGRLVSNKGMDVLVNAFARIAAQNPLIDLIIVGDGDARDSIQSLVDEKHLSGRVKLVGRKNRQEVSAYFNQCHIFVMPSPCEPFGIVCLEAMRSGKPVIATNAGGPPEFIDHGQTGLLVNSSDVDSLAAALSRLLSDDSDRLRIAANARKSVEQFDWKQITDRYLQIYERLLAPNQQATKVKFTS